MKSLLTRERVLRDKRTRFNPLSSLTPQRLTAALDSFEAGYVEQASRIWSAIARRDDLLPSLIGKRLGALARYGWEILAIADSEEARAHKRALEYFFNTVRTVNSADENERGGLKLALRQIGGAIAMRYSVHEVVWREVKDNGVPMLTAELRHVPLWFFENTRGKLALLETPGGTEGVPLDPQASLVSAGAGLMEACSALYMFKRLPLSDWLNYCEAFGLPGVVGHTSAASGSAEGEAMQNAVAAIGGQLAFVLYGANENKIDFITPGTSGELPFDPLIERCDRGMAILWRGGDLGTMSAGSGSGQGASIQGNESDLIEQDDAAWASETLQRLARMVILRLFGTDSRAYIRVKCKKTPEIRLDLELMQAAVQMGVPVSSLWASEKFGIPLAKKGEALLSPRKGGVA